MKKFLIFIIFYFQSFAWAVSPIEQGIRLFNQSEYQQAEKIFQQQSDNGSAYATFWLGVAQYKNLQHFEAGETFLHAAEMGDPWAMGVLSGYDYYVNNPCDYLGWPCDDKWHDLAVKGWEKEVEKGNGKALLQLQFFTNRWRNYVPFLGRYLIDKKYIEALKNGGFNAVYYLVRFGGLSTEKEIEYLTLVANKGYAPAMVSLYYNQISIGNINKAILWINKALDLGYPEAAEVLFLSYDLGEKDRNGNEIISPNPKKAYLYNRIFAALGGKDETSSIVSTRLIKDGQPVSDENGDPVFEVLVSEQEQAEMDKQVAHFVKDIKPNKFLDETSIDLF